VRQKIGTSQARLGSPGQRGPIICTDLTLDHDKEIRVRRGCRTLDLTGHMNAVLFVGDFCGSVPRNEQSKEGMICGSVPRKEQ
jgi:hypothetical protein